MEQLLQKIWMRPILRYVFVMVASAISDFWASFYLYSVSHGWILYAALSGFLIPFINFAFMTWFIETKDIKERLKLTFFSALGMTMGATLLLILV